MFISGCILTKNNEDTIGLAIRSLKNHVDRIVVVDTGSKDSTILIASESGAEIHTFSWCNDFSKARNYCLQLVSNDQWVLWLDSDEEFFWSNPVPFRDWVKGRFKKHTDVLLLEIRHIQTGEQKKAIAMTHAERMFSPMSYQYKGKVHESIVYALSDGCEKSIQECQYAWINHIGYSSEFQEEKHERNMSLLVNELTENPSNPLTFRYIANEAYNFGDYSESLIYASRALESIPLSRTYSRAQAYFYSIMSNVHLNNIDEARKMIQLCNAELPHYSDPYYIAGELCFSNSLWEEALKWYDEWFDSLKQEKGIFPDYFISMREEIYNRRQYSNKKHNGSISMKDVKKMSLAILITFPELESDWEELIFHIKEKFTGVDYSIGVYCDNNIQIDQQIKSLWKEHKVYTFYNMDWKKTVNRFVKQKNTHYLWKWEANERLSSDFSLESIIYHINNNRNEININRFSDRIGCSWKERRIWDVRHTEYHDFQDDCCYSCNRHEGYHENLIVMEKPLMIPKELQKKYDIRIQNQPSFMKILTNFGLQRYEDVINESVLSSDDFWMTAQFFKALSFICIEKIEEAANIVYEMINNENDDNDNVFDFVYLHSKLAQNVTVNEMKKESIELLNELLEENPIIETNHLKIFETHWWAQIGELYWQIGDVDQAIKSFRESLEVSSFKNIEAAYRLVEIIHMQYKEEGLDRIVRNVLSIFQDSPNGKSILSLMFDHLNLQEWALLFKSEDIKTKPNANAIEEDNLVSIILPIYNDTKYLIESIRSILSQSYVNLELIIVDDGSTVDIRKYTDRFKYDSRVKYHRIKSNVGIPNALNYGIAQAAGSIMTWTSADNFAHSRWVEKMVLSLESDPNAVAVYSSFYHVDEDGIVTGLRKDPFYKLNGLQNSGPSFFWRTSILRKSGGFDESLFGIEDRDFVIRVAMQGKIIYHSEPLYYYRIHNQSLSSQIESGSYGGWNELHDKLKRKWLYLSFV